MTGRAAMLAFIGAVAAVQNLPVLPGFAARCAIGLSGMLACLLAAVPARIWGRMGDWFSGAASSASLPARPAGRVPGHVADRPYLTLLRAGLVSMGAALGGAWHAMETGQSRLDDALPAEHQNQVARLELRVTSLTEESPDGIRFDAQVLSSQPAGIPKRIRVAWLAPRGAAGSRAPAAVPGQRLRTAVVLKRPHAAQNPHAVDGEARLFQRNVRAIATVRGKPALLGDEPWSRAGVMAHRVRHVLRERMRTALAGTRYGAVIIALALGDQAGVAREDWQVFNATGITHLVSISGLHVTLVAGMAGAAVGWTWRRLRWRSVWLAEYLPAPIAAIAAAIVVAWLYCVLAGWGIPARRTFFTLAVAGAAGAMRIPLSTSRVLVLAATVVTALDPWAPMAPGFWLSFGAVAIVLAWTRSAARKPPAEAGRWRALAHGLASAARLQCVVTAGLTPILAFLTQQIALAAPFANAVAIPAVSFIVTPLALLCALASAVFGAAGPASWAGRVAQWCFEWTMAWVVWLARQDWAVIDVAAPPAILLALALAGMGWALLPPGCSSRNRGWLLVLPALCWRPDRPAPGEWTLSALDVGQGGAIVVQTARHVLLFDAGPWHRSGTDGAQRVVWPYLRARGVRRIDTLVVSHADLDHAGGMYSLLRSVPVGKIHAAFDVQGWLRRDFHTRQRAWPAPLPGRIERCRAGAGWEADGVQFRFVHPEAPGALHAAAPPVPASGKMRRSNEAGCVLVVQGRYHAALLPGDVGTAQERRFAGALPRVDVVIAPHHGSATSSGASLVQATQPIHVIAQAGYLNRFRHPSASVERRWKRAGAVFWRTDRHGAVIAHSRAGGLTLQAQRDIARRYWQGR